MKKWKWSLAVLLCAALVAGSVPQWTVQSVWAAEGETEEQTGGSGTGAGNAQTTEEGNTGETLNGNAADISISGVSVSGGKAGGKVKISFSVTGSKNNKKHYEVETIEKVYPVLNESFPFEMDDEAYRVTGGNGNSVSCSYTFRAKKNLQTAYYMTGFTIVYTRRATDGKTTEYAGEYTLTKSISVSLTAQPTATPKAEKKQETAKDADISLTMRSDPYGVHGGNCSVSFTASSPKYRIRSVVPVIDNNFPFESTSDAYKVIRSGGTRRLSCAYRFRVKENVATGYQGVVFRIGYVRNGQAVTIDKTVNVALKGKKDAKKDVSKARKSTPRVMVAGYQTDVKTVRPNAKFLLTLDLKNNAGQTVHNLKLTLSTANGEFLPLSGASTYYIAQIAPGETAKVAFWMKASAGLGSKSYQVTAKTEYEDGKANGYNAEDQVSIPVVQKDRISLTEITPPDMLSVGGVGDLSFSINNMGREALSNVTVRCKGKDFSCEKTFAGNIAAGATSYANLTLTGEQVTPEDSDGVCTIQVRYENAAGETRQYTKKTNIYVTEEMPEEEPIDEEVTEETKAGVPVGVWIAAGVAAVVVAGVVIRRIVRKRRQKKEEWMDDELL